MRLLVATLKGFGAMCAICVALGAVAAVGHFCPPWVWLTGIAVLLCWVPLTFLFYCDYRSSRQ